MKTAIRVGGPTTGGRDQFEAMLEMATEAEKLPTRLGRGGPARQDGLEDRGDDLAAWPVVGETLDDSEEVVSLYARGKRLLRQGDWLHAARVPL